jgi:hypothetical protein
MSELAKVFVGLLINLAFAAGLLLYFKWLDRKGRS